MALPVSALVLGILSGTNIMESQELRITFLVYTRYVATCKCIASFAMWFEQYGYFLYVLVFGDEQSAHEPFIQVFVWSNIGNFLEPFCKLNS